MTIGGRPGSEARAIPRVPWLRSATRKRKGKESVLLPIGIGRVLAFATDEHKLDGCQQLLQVNGLPDHFLRPHGPGFIETFFVMTPGDNDHPAGVFTLTELPKHLDTVHA